MIHRNIARFARLIPLALLAACTDPPKGVSYQTLWIQATTPSTSGFTVQLGAKCLTLPLLLGSQVDDQLPLVDGAIMQIRATRESVLLRFVNTPGGESDTHSVSDTQLQSKFNDSFNVLSSSGSEITIALDSACH